MSLQAKRRWVVALLAAFTVWPLVHRQIVDRYLINPWRLFGWAMYCVPAYEPVVKFYGSTAAGYGQLTYPLETAQDQLQLRQFIEDRGQLGRWVKPDLLAARVLARYPQLDSLLVVVARPIYDTKTAEAHPIVDEYAYERRSESPDLP